VGEQLPNFDKLPRVPKPVSPLRSATAVPNGLASRLFVRGEQRVEALAQRLVIAALAVEPRRTLDEGLREREGEQGFFVRGSHGISWYGTAQL